MMDYEVKISVSEGIEDRSDETEKDIYFQNSWQKLFAKREGLPLKEIYFTCEHGSVTYSFLEREVEIGGKKYPYKDILTPYAFCGPLLKPVSECSTCRSALAETFNNWFQEYCKREGIVAEYVQFNPWVANHKEFEGIYSMSFRSKIVAIDLSVNDILMDEIHTKKRGQIRKAMKSGVKICYDSTGAMIPQFLECYNYTIDKYDAISYYQFTAEFLQELLDTMKGNAEIVCAMYQDKCVNSSIVLRGGEFCHYFLAGNTPEGMQVDGNSLLIYDSACRAKEKGCTLYVLGGAEANMADFKTRFTRTEGMDYFSGKKIRLEEVYNELVEANGITDTSYFPAYRDPGKRFYSTWITDNKND